MSEKIETEKTEKLPMVRVMLQCGPDGNPQVRIDADEAATGRHCTLTMQPIVALEMARQLLTSYVSAIVPQLALKKTVIVGGSDGA